MDEFNEMLYNFTQEHNREILEKICARLKEANVDYTATVNIIRGDPDVFGLRPAMWTLGNVVLDFLEHDKRVIEEYKASQKN